MALCLNLSVVHGLLLFTNPEYAVAGTPTITAAMCLGHALRHRSPVAASPYSE